jgi:acetyl-CoA/propionyl-CoA carboxylase biotin carboxyl carrier protein
MVVEVNGRRFQVTVPELKVANGGATPVRRVAPSVARASGNDITSPVQGTVIRVAAEAGARVAQGDVIAVVEAMKMENDIRAHRDGTLASIEVAVGAKVGAGGIVAVLAE